MASGGDDEKLDAVSKDYRLVHFTLENS